MIEFVRRRHETGARMLAMMAIAGTLLFAVPPAYAQGELSRRAKTKVPPTYSELAHRLNITGTVKVQLVVAPNGSIKDSKILGGHPLLVNAAMEALRKWKFEPATEETTGIVEFKFEPE